MGTTRAPDKTSACRRSTGTILIVTTTPGRYKGLAGDLEFIAPDLAPICAAVALGAAHRAIVAEVIAPDGRELGYRIAQLLRMQYRVTCPIYLTAVNPTASARAYAMQCGATRLMRDDEDLLEDLVHFGLGASATAHRL